jgi:NAD(P)H dehydrogenase (quinone)
MRKVLVVYCHPNPKSFTRAVLQALEAGLASGGAAVERVDLHADAFDPVLVVDEHRRRRDLDQVEDTRRYRELLAWCDLVAFVYPLWWGGFPAMMKGFVDRVMVSGLAYSFAGRPKAAVLPTGLLRDKEAHLFYTLDAPRLVAWLDLGYASAYATIFKYCGFRLVRRHYLAGLKHTTHAQRVAWLREVEQRGRALAAR